MPGLDRAGNAEGTKRSRLAQASSSRRERESVFFSARLKEIDDLVNEVKRGLVKQEHEDGITPAIGHPLKGLTRGTTTNLGQELSAIRIQIAEVPLMGSQLAEKRQFGHLALDGARALARSTLPEPLEGRPGCTFSPVRDRAPN